MSSSDTERREHPRHRVDWKVEVTAREWSEVLALTVTSASAGGLFVRSERLADVGSEVGVVLHLPDGTPLALTGVVVRVAPEVPGFGLRLEAERAADLSLLSAMAAAFGEPDPGPAAATPVPRSRDREQPLPTPDGAEPVTSGVYVHHFRRKKKKPGEAAARPGPAVSAQETSKERGNKERKRKEDRREQKQQEQKQQEKKQQEKKQQEKKKDVSPRPERKTRSALVEAYRRFVPPPPPRRRRKPPPLPIFKTGEKQSVPPEPQSPEASPTEATNKGTSEKDP